MKKLNKKIQANRGMTYVELIVVLSIFALLSSVAIFNYGEFQARVDIKNLASDIASKIVEAQKYSLSGVLPLTQSPEDPDTWKPSYGVYFNLNKGAGSDNSFIYFVDLDQDGEYDDPSFCSTPGTAECIEKIRMTKGNTISGLNVFYADGSPESLNNLTITFARPNSSPLIQSTQITPQEHLISYVQISIVSPQGAEHLVKLYPSGRVQTDLPAIEEEVFDIGGEGIGPGFIPPGQQSGGNNKNKQ